MATPISLKKGEYPNSDVEFYLNTETFPYDRSILFIGIPGQGKSSLINFLLKEDKFQVQHSLIPCTNHSVQALTEINGRSVLFVDTPGFVYTKEDNTILAELAKAFFFVRKQGISAIGIVINPNVKMNSDEYKMMERFITKISPNVWGHVFVVFTHEKQTTAYHSSGKDYISQVLRSNDCPKFLQLLDQNCERRFMYIESGESWQEKCSELTQFVEDIMINKGFLKPIVMEEIDEKCSELQILRNDKEKCIKIIESLNDLSEIALVNEKIEKIDSKMLKISEELKSRLFNWVGMTIAIGSLVGVGAAVGIAVPALAPLAAIFAYGLYSKFK